MLTKDFWKGAGERGLKTFIQSFIPAFLLALGLTNSNTFDAWTAPWLASLQSALGVAIGATLLSFLTALGNADFVAGKPNVVEVPAPAADTVGEGTVPDTSLPDVPVTNDAAAKQVAEDSAPVQDEEDAPEPVEP